MNEPYDYEALWMKTKLFINRAMDTDCTRSFDEQALWAALALELVAKAALAKFSPLLIAEPNEEGVNLLIACGLVKGDAHFTSLRAKTLFARCQRAFKPFSMSEAIAITNGRNEYLHSAGIGFTLIPQAVWWPRFWAQMVVLVSALDKNIEELVGVDREGIVHRHLAQNAKNIEHRVEMLTERAKQRLSQYRAGTLPARIANEWKPGIELGGDLKYSCLQMCPACEEDGLLEGDEATNTEVGWDQIDEDNYSPTVTLTIAADYFSCSNCHLVLDEYELIEQAGLPVEFDADGDYRDLFEEPEYGND